jgi:hypothetical protein
MRSPGIRILALSALTLVLLGAGLALALGPGKKAVVVGKAKQGQCSAVFGGTEALTSALSSAPPGAVLCLADGNYAKLTLSASKAAPGVTVRSADPAGATIAGASLSGSNLTLSRFVITDGVQVQPGADGMTIDHNRITGGGQGIDMPTSSTSVNDTKIIGNKLIGPFGEDAIHLNRYHDGDGDGIGVLIEGNEITNVRENGNHSDCLQTVWVGDHIVFRKNYLHDNRCQGFFMSDQTGLGEPSGPVVHVAIEDNLMLRDAAPCDPPDSGCGPPLILQIIGPTRGIRIAGNTIWTAGNGSSVSLREGPFGHVGFADNVIYRGWTDWTGGFPSYSEKEDTVCLWEGMPRLSPSSKHSCHPHFLDPRHDDFRLRDGRGVDWAPADQHYGP